MKRAAEEDLKKQQQDEALKNAEKSAWKLGNVHGNKKVVEHSFMGIMNNTVGRLSFGSFNKDTEARNKEMEQLKAYNKINETKDVSDEELSKYLRPKNEKKRFFSPAGKKDGRVKKIKR